MSAEAGTSSSGEVLDQSVLEELRCLEAEIEADVLDEMIALFLQSAPLRLETLRHAAAGGDAAAIVWTAHSLKGSSGIFGARRMAQLCDTLQIQAQSAPQDDLRALVERLCDEFVRVRAALEALC